MQALHLQPFLHPIIVRHTWGCIKVTKIDRKKCKHGTLQNEKNFGMKTKKCGENDFRKGMKKPKVFLYVLMQIGEQNHIMNEFKLELKAY
jgi:hypothetical protein